MSTDRRPYRRESEESRRDALIAAALDLVAEGGAQAATVRAIAERAGVTPGLIRHYFSSKEELTRAAYRRLMERMTLDSTANLPPAATVSAEARLAAFVSASLRPPVIDPLRLGLWAGFLHGVRSDGEMRQIHEQSYHGYRDLLQDMIVALRRNASADQCRADAIACNAVIDGLWLEGSALTDSFAPGELERIGLAAVGAILHVNLASALPAVTGDTP
jgi:TetR/AcrR family transcriptional regulator, transcriptional repressor of bet genes